MFFTKISKFSSQNTAIFPKQWCLQWNEIMKALGQPIFFIIWRFSLLRGKKTIEEYSNGTLEKFQLSEIPPYYVI